MRRDFHHLLNPSDDLPSGTASTPEESPIWKDAYTSPGAPGGSAIHFEASVSTGTANLQQNDSSPESILQRFRALFERPNNDSNTIDDRQGLRALFEGLIWNRNQQGDGFACQELAMLLERLDSSAFLELLRNIRANHGEGAWGNVFDHLHQIDPVFARQIIELYEQGQWPGGGGFQPQMDSRVSECFDWNQIVRNPTLVSALRMLRENSYSEYGFQAPEEILSLIRNNFGAAALSFLRQVVRHPPSTRVLRYAELLIAGIMEAANR